MITDGFYFLELHGSSLPRVVALACPPNHSHAEFLPLAPAIILDMIFYVTQTPENPGHYTIRSGDSDNYLYLASDATTLKFGPRNQHKHSAYVFTFHRTGLVLPDTVFHT